MGINELAQKYAVLREQKDELNNQLKEVSQKINDIESELIDDLHQAGLSRVDVSGLGSFSISTRCFYKVSDREALMEHLRQHDDEDILSVNHNTLNSYIKDWKTKYDDQDVPGVEFFSKAQIRMRKAK